MSRLPAVAGRFYSGDSKSLTEEIRRHIEDYPKKTRVFGTVSPHAGFLYSGDVAGAVYSRIEIPDTVILLGPNHTGQGERVAVMTHGTWEMPQGNLEVDQKTGRGNPSCIVDRQTGRTSAPRRTFSRNPVALPSVFPQKIQDRPHLSDALEPRGM